MVARARFGGRSRSVGWLWAVSLFGCRSEAPHARVPEVGQALPALPAISEQALPVLASAPASSGPWDAAAPRTPESVQSARETGALALHDAAGRPAGVVDVPEGFGVHPLVVAAHMSYGRADLTCASARKIFGPRPYVVCPHSVEDARIASSWKSPENLRSELERAVAAARERFGAAVSAEHAVYFGHSQAGMIAPVALGLAGATTFEGALLFEGLPPNAPSARVYFTRTTLRRLLLVSGQGGWAAGHALLAKTMQTTPVVTKAVHLGEVGHYLTAATEARLAVEVRWLLGAAYDSAAVNVGPLTVDASVLP